MHQAIREDDLWLAAWLMQKIVQKPYKLTKDQTKLLEAEQIHRFNLAHTAFLALISTAQNDAQEDFNNWFQKGSTFESIEQASWKKHSDGPEILKLRKAIKAYARAAGYLTKIISMSNQPTMKATEAIEMEENEAIEMEAMGSAPSAKTMECAKLEDEEWIIIRQEEAQKGGYYGLQWSTVK
ncbi:hypothetical protein PtA15_11A567 [Puccinia triticina]|uniref:Uncharacterized protein n=1 Tax=Puccinia triticina TaxID=208348 RepID=A0ABY7CY51_9BASI|nr:uncharacterized protein PtA15_11A567 [Puccinia triticina]WAQ89875.1 hypothetical protein PtA15_11A567 [Puccinia triticina]